MSTQKKSQYTFRVEYSGEAEVTIEARNENEALRILKKSCNNVHPDWKKAPKSIVDVSESFEIGGDTGLEEA